MNTANLQLEGLLLALSSIIDLLKRKGIASEEEIRSALARAETAALDDPTRPGELSSANVEAVLFPIRYLAAEAARREQEGLRPFSAVASGVGQTKRARHAPV